MIYTIGQWTKRVELIDFARQHMTKLLKKAYIEEKGSWARRFRNDGSLDTDKEWWIFCELDQVAATLSLRDPRFCEYIAHTYPSWFTYMVDDVHGEVWHMVNGETNKPVPGFPKQHAWKNGWHTFEHALIGYITGQQLHNLPVTLYYAFQGGTAAKETVYPYIYHGCISDPLTPDENGVYKVNFTDIR